MNQSDPPKQGQSLLEYRVLKLEEAMLKVSEIADVVTRWDERFASKGGMMDFAKSILLIDEHERKLASMDTEIREIKSYLNKAIGAFLVLSALIQIAAPVLVAYIKTHL